MSRAGRDAGRRNRDAARVADVPVLDAPVLDAPVVDASVLDLRATTFAPRAMLLELVATLVGCTLAGAAVGLWLHSIDPSGGWSQDDVEDMLACAGLGLLAGLVVGIPTSIGAAWTSITLRRHLARGRRRARLVLLAATLVLWAVCVWMLLFGTKAGATNWFGWVLMLPALLGAELVVWCGVPWVRRALDRP